MDAKDWIIAGPPQDHVRVNDGLVLVPEFYKELGFPWSKGEYTTHQFLRNMGYDVSDRGLSPVFNSEEELVKFIEWAKTKLKAIDKDTSILQEGDVVELAGIEWVVSIAQGAYLYALSGKHYKHCQDLCAKLSTSQNKNLSLYAQSKGYALRFCGDFPEFNTVNELTSFFNHCKIKLNEVRRTSETDRNTNQRRGAYSPGQASLIVPSARYCGNAISVGKSKSRIASAKKTVSPAYL